MLPEIAEQDATGECAAIFARIRQVQGTSVVNFIWRHLATIDGALEWAWPRAEAALPAISHAIGPVVAWAEDHVAAAGLADGLRLTLPPEALAVVRTYERGNAWNLLAMTTLAALRAGAALPPGPEGAGPPLAAVAAVPPMPRYDALAPGLQGSIDRLAGAGPAADSGVRPSLWVHLGLWPAVLPAVAEACIPVLASARFHTAHAALIGEGCRLLGLPAPAPAPAAPIDRAIARFHRRIPEMVLIGRVLQRAHYSA